jgi:hypothetical protein
VLDWLFEGRRSVYLLLAALAVVVTALWVRSGFVLIHDWSDRAKPAAKPRRRLSLFPALLGLLLVLACGYFLLDRAVETHWEEIERKLQEMARAVSARNVDGVMAHISERFNAQGLDRAGLRGMVDRAIQTRLVENLTIWDVVVPDSSGRVTFMAKPSGSRLPTEVANVPGFRIRGEFVQDADGQWRLRTFEVFGPAGGGSIPIPQLP